LIHKGKHTRIYRGYDTSELRPVAIRVVRKEMTIRSIPRDFTYLSRLVHPHICRCYDADIQESVNQFGELERTEALVMEFASGGDIIAYTSMHPESRKKLLTDVLKGLEYLHENGLVHGSLNSAQVLIKETADGPQAMISCLEMNKTKKNCSFLDYCAPEQLMPNAYTEYDHRADLWAWGCMVYEVYTGNRLFVVNESPMQTEDLLWKMGAEPYDLSPIPMLMREFAARCLKSDPERRINTATELLQLIMENDLQREKDVQQISGKVTEMVVLSKKDSSLVKGKDAKKVSSKKPPSGLVNFFNSFRRF
jgi:serine/threonine protein kinase